MSVFTEAKADIWDLFREGPGEPAFYRPKAGGVIETHVSIGRVSFVNDGRVHGYLATIKLPVVDVAECFVDDRIELNGESWEVRSNQGEREPRGYGRLWHYLQCRKIGTVGTSGGGRG